MALPVLQNRLLLPAGPEDPNNAFVSHAVFTAGHTDPNGLGGAADLLDAIGGGSVRTLPVARAIPADTQPSTPMVFPSNDALNEVTQAGVVPQETAAEIAAGEGFWFNTGINSGHWGLPPGTSSTVDSGDDGTLVSETITPSSPTPPAQAADPSNSGGAGLAGNGPLLDAISSLFGGGQQSPLDASSSPSTAAIEALQPTATTTFGSGNPALLILIGGGAIAGIAWFVMRHKKKPEPPQ